MNAGVILFLIFAVCVLIGVPISMSLGIGSLAAVALGCVILKRQSNKRI